MLHLDLDILLSNIEHMSDIPYVVQAVIAEEAGPLDEVSALRRAYVGYKQARKRGADVGVAGVAGMASAMGKSGGGTRSIRKVVKDVVKDRRALKKFNPALSASLEDAEPSIFEEKIPDVIAGLGKDAGIVQRWLRKHAAIFADPALKGIVSPGSVKGIGGFFKNRRVRRYREILWRKHRAEIFRELEPIVVAVMRHDDEVASYINSIRSNTGGVEVPQRVLKTLTGLVIRNRDKFYVNDPSEPGKTWSRFDFDTWGTWVIGTSAQYVAYTRSTFRDVLQVLLGVAFADYVYNKYEEDKSKYVL